mgnify:CR=1 FL=1
MEANHKDLKGPDDNELITLRMTGEAAKSFTAMLNMNSVRNAYGHRIVFHWEKSGGEWCLAMTEVEVW